MNRSLANVCNYIIKLNKISKTKNSQRYYPYVSRLNLETESERKREIAEERYDFTTPKVVWSSDVPVALSVVGTTQHNAMNVPSEKFKILYFICMQDRRRKLTSFLCPVLMPIKKIVPEMN